MTDIVNVSRSLQRGSRQRLLLSQQLADYFCLIQNVRGPLPSHGKCSVPRNFNHLPDAVKLLLYNDFKCAVRQELEKVL
jgi:hypothetical protein